MSLFSPVPGTRPPQTRPPQTWRGHQPGPPNVAWWHPRTRGLRTHQAKRNYSLHKRIRARTSPNHIWFYLFVVFPLFCCFLYFAKSHLFFFCDTLTTSVTRVLYCFHQVLISFKRVLIMFVLVLMGFNKF